MKELNQIELLEKGVKIGAAVSLNDFQDVLKSEIASKPENQTRIFKAIVDMLHWFAGKQIRNVAVS